LDVNYLLIFKIICYLLSLYLVYNCLCLFSKPCFAHKSFLCRIICCLQFLNFYIKLVKHGPVGLSVMPAQAVGERSAVAFVGSGRLNSYICTGRRRKYENSFVHPADHGTAQAYRNMYGFRPSGQIARRFNFISQSTCLYYTAYCTALHFCEVLSLKKCLMAINNPKTASASSLVAMSLQYKINII